MLTLPSALAALRAWRQFIVCQFVPSTTRPGKIDKFPIDWQTGRVASAHDPAIWLDFDAAASMAMAFGADYGVGFVFTVNDPFWFIDVDACREDDRWSATAMALLARFNGAAVEISYSGDGLHLIGTGDAGLRPPARKVKYGNYFDLYTEGRFVALTGTGALGDAATTHTPALLELVRDYLTPDPHETSDDWNMTPCVEWRGPEDDAQLIERALRSVSSVSAFGNVRACFRDLWEANVDMLVRAYPPDQGGGGYDESKADSGLAQHLAFWTGKHHERILRLMKMSALVREKWHQRDDYLERTIKRATARQVDVLTDKPPERAEVAMAVAGSPLGKAITGETFLTTVEQIKLFEGCVYVMEPHRVLVPGGHVLKPDQFRVLFGGYSFPMDPQNERVVRNAWEAFTESQSFRSPRADRFCFRPECAPGAIVEESGLKLANIWWPVETPRAKGDVSKFLAYLEKLLPDEMDRKKFLSYLAAVLQYPGRKFQWAPFLQGVEGNGKTLIVTLMARGVGDRYSHLPNIHDENFGKFNGWLTGKLFIGIEEVYAPDKRNVMESLKPLITNRRLEIQGKGADQTTGDNRANMILCSNYKDAIPKKEENRRYAIFFSAQQSVADLERDGMGGRYFPDLYDWFEGEGTYAGQAPGYAVINDFLRSYQIEDELNPAVGMHRAPITTSTAEAIALSVGSVEQEVLEAIGQELPGFAGGWVSSMALDKLLARINAERRIPPRKRRDLLVSLGYDWHPALNDGRVNSSVMPDGGKPRLFVKIGHPNNMLQTPTLVSDVYTKAQSRAQTEHAKFGT